ncbi:MAG TPA: cation transporter [Fimbriimonadaceae bacterium]|nr:cation transporter [Fimbriimonadaceae bacterium]
MTTDIFLRAPRSRAVALQWLTVVHGLLEGGASLIASGLAGSVALMSFGLDSMVEVLSASVVLWRVLAVGREGRFAISERNGLRVVGFCFVVLAGSVAWDASLALFGRRQPQESLLGIVVAAISVVAMPLVANAKRRLSGEIGSASLQADARQSDFCACLAFILLAGLLLFKLFGLWWVDSVSALLMSPVILWEGVQALRGHACGCASCAS